MSDLLLQKNNNGEPLIQSPFQIQFTDYLFSIPTYHTDANLGCHCVCLGVQVSWVWNLARTFVYYSYLCKKLIQTITYVLDFTAYLQISFLHLLINYLKMFIMVFSWLLRKCWGMLPISQTNLLAHCDWS